MLLALSQLVNLCANDGQRLFDACMLGVFALAGIASVGGAAYSIFLLGAWGILGFAIFFLFIPIQASIPPSSSLIRFGWHQLRNVNILVADIHVKPDIQAATSSGANNG